MPAPSIFADHVCLPSPNGKQWPIVSTGHGFARALPPLPLRQIPLQLDAAITALNDGCKPAAWTCCI